jgi:tetratricopeptide (TPR) repeat protein
MQQVYYKYRADSTYTEDIITSSQVFLSTAAGLNDPFECSLQEIGKEWIAKQVEEMQMAGLAGFVMSANRSIKNGADFFGCSPVETERMLEELKVAETLTAKVAYRAEFMKKQTGHYPTDSRKVFSQIDAQLLDVGIFSMTGNPAHPLMWAHYAGDHTGVCLGFEKIKGSRLDNKEHFLPVIYSDKLPEMDGEGFRIQMSFSIDENMAMYPSSHKIAFGDETFQKAITTKPTAWRYEDEWRYVEPYPGLFDWPAPLTEITFGLRCKEERRNHYVKLCETYITHPIHFFQIVKKRGANELERVPCDVAMSVPKHNQVKKEFPSMDRQEIPLEEFAVKLQRLLRQEKYGDVLFLVEENLKDSPEDTVLLHYKGVALGYSQQPEEALACFEKITEKLPEVAQSWYQKACALIDLRREEEAKQSLFRAYELDPNDASIAFNLAIQILKTEEDSEQKALPFLKVADKLGHRRAFPIIRDIEDELKNANET